jgi:hypothetical protein
VCYKKLFIHLKMMILNLKIKMMRNYFLDNNPISIFNKLNINNKLLIVIHKFQKKYLKSLYKNMNKVLQKKLSTFYNKVINCFKKMKRKLYIKDQEILMRFYIRIMSNKKIVKQFIYK